MNAQTNTVPENDAAIVLSDVFAAIRRSSDNNDKVTSNLILGLFTYEASFSKDQLEYYFRTDATKRKDVQTNMLSTNDDEFKKEFAFLASQAEKHKTLREHDQIETIMRRHKSLRNIFHSCMQACYFLRVGGNLAGDAIGPVKTLKLIKDRFVVSYIDEDNEVTRLQGKFSSAAIIKAGQGVVEKLLDKRPAAAKATTTSVNVSPVAVVDSAVKTFNTMIDTALNDTTTSMQKAGAKVERATLDDMPDDVNTNIDTMLAKLLSLKFAHEGKIETVDVISWMTDTIKNTEIVSDKQVRPLRKSA